MDNAFDYVKLNGIPQESAYPYSGRDSSCKKSTSSFKIGGFVDVPANDPK